MRSSPCNFVLLLLTSLVHTTSPFTTSTTHMKQQQSTMKQPKIAMSATTPLQIGHIMDTLRKDYPLILTEDIDYTIYHSQLQVKDPSGLTVTGLNKYKTSLQLVHTVVNLFYKKPLITFRTEFLDSKIRVSWNAELVPNIMPHNNIKVIDGISVYTVQDGLIVKHEIEKLVINNSAVTEYEDGVLAGLASGLCLEGAVYFDHHIKHAAAAGSSSSFEMSGGGSGGVNSVVPESADEFIKKNEIRKKFGLPPISIQEFNKINQELEQQQREQEALKMSRINRRQQQQQDEKQQRSKRFSLFKNLNTDTCETNFDCERPQVCCDFIVVKKCCSSGQFVGHSLEPATVPVVQLGDGGEPDDPRYY